MSMLSSFQFETKFSELTDDDKDELGVKLGNLLHGGTQTPEDLLKGGFLMNHNIVGGDDAMKDEYFRGGVEGRVVLCDDCAKYAYVEEVNDFGLCPNCQAGEEE